MLRKKTEKLSCDLKRTHADAAEEIKTMEANKNIFKNEFMSLDDKYQTLTRVHQDLEIRARAAEEARESLEIRARAAEEARKSLEKEVDYWKDRCSYVCMFYKYVCTCIRVIYKYAYIYSISLRE